MSPQSETHIHASTDSGADSGAHCYSPRSARSGKESWGGRNIGNAHKYHLSPVARLSAQALFYSTTLSAQKAAARLASQKIGKGFQTKVKPQLTPCYTDYPPSLAAYAAVGLTAHLEFQARSNLAASTRQLAPQVVQTIQREFPKLDPTPLGQMAMIVVNSVQARLLYEDLHKYDQLCSVENYRLFLASCQSMNFPSVPSILNSVILFGDVLPDWEGRGLHAMTEALLLAIETASKPYFVLLPQAKPPEAIALGRNWILDILRALAEYLPEIQETNSPAPLPGDGEGTGRYQPESEHEEPNIAPPGGKHPPSLFDPSPISGADGLMLPGRDIPSIREALKEMCRPRISRKDVQEDLAKRTPQVASRDSKVLHMFHKVVVEASRQDQKWEDTRSDLAEVLCRITAYGEGPITGQVTEGHEIEMSIAGEYYGGQLFDRPIDPKAVLAGADSLLPEANALYRRLRKLIFPNREPNSTEQRLVTNGGLDPARLPIAECSEVIYKRYRTSEGEDSRGRPLILIVNDGSGSVGMLQMKLMKILSMAWIKTSLKNRIKILAGIYCHVPVQGGLGQPLVEWLYHPEKTPTIAPKDTLRSIAGLPNKGRGGQADAISLQFMLDEAVRLAKGKNIYLILIADFKWCPSFQDPQSRLKKRPLGAELEVRTFFENAYKKLGDKLHVTMVGLDALKPETYANLVDKVIAVPKAELSDYTAVADRIGTYVANCVRERRKLSKH